MQRCRVTNGCRAPVGGECKNAALQSSVRSVIPMQHPRCEAAVGEGDAKGADSMNSPVIAGEFGQAARPAVPDGARSLVLR